MRSAIVFKFFVLLGVLLLIPVNLQAETTLTGKVKVIVIDHQNGLVEKRFALRTDDGKLLDLDYSNYTSAQNTNLKSGALISVTGDLEKSDQVHVRKQQVINSGSDISISVTTGSRTLAVFIVNLQGSSVSCTSSQIQSALYTATPSMRGTYEQSSDGTLTWNSDANGDSSVDIFGPFTISYSASPCSYAAWANAADTAAVAAGVNLNSYQHRAYVLPNTTSSTCGWAGLGDLGCFADCQIWVNYCSNVIVYAHELGHNLGMEHSATDTDNNGTVENEYGDYSCPMAAAAGQQTVFNAPHIDQMGWYDHTSNRIKTITSGGTFTLYPLEFQSSSAGGLQVIKIRKGNGQSGLGEYYYLSYRSRVNDYGYVNSSYRDKINVHTYDASHAYFSKFIDALADGESFQDTNIGLTVTQLSHSSDYSTVSVTLSGSSGGDPDSGTETGGGPPTASDSDGDGVSDAQEATDNTDPNDPGSFQMRLSSPIYSPWNSFLSMTNILELVNPGSSSINVTLTLYLIDGTIAHTENLVISSGSQVDKIVNDMSGFVSDSYGLVKVEYSGGDLDGRMSFYRSTDSFQSFEFAYSVAFKNVSYGGTAVGFNTYQPSTNSADSSYQVLNWLTLINLASSTKSFTINTYNQTGDLITSRSQSIPANGRVDIDGGHGVVGSNVVGLHVIRPIDNSAPYISQLIRYGATGSSYSFAFPLAAQTATGAEVTVPISTQFGEANWLEVANSSSSAITVGLAVKGENGESLNTQTLSLAAHAQQHIDVASILGTAKVGYAILTPSASNSMVAQSMFYFRATNGSMLGMYGSSFTETLDDELTGSYNLFLGMQNWLRISNVSSSTRTITLVINTGSLSNSQTLTLGANSSTSLPLHDTTTYGTQTNSYGRIQLQTDQSGSLLADLIRLHNYNSTLDFAMPTAVRP